MAGPLLGVPFPIGALALFPPSRTGALFERIFLEFTIS